MTLMRRSWLRWGVALLLVVAVFGSFMRTAAGAIALGNTAGTQGTSVSSLTWAHTVGAGSSRLLIVRVANINSGVSVSGVTYGGVALTQLQTATSGSGSSHVRVALWYLIAPAAGTANVVVTLSGSTRVQGYSNNLTGVDQTVPFGTPVTASGAGNSMSVTASGATGDLMIDVAAAQGGAGTATAGAGQSALSGSTGPTASDVLGMGSTEAGAASVTLSWSTTASSPWVSLGVAIKQALGYTVGGTVFEDVNYGGGAGRSLASSSGTGVNGATVELYSSGGTYVSSTTSAGGGAYSFAGVTAGTYYVRVVNSTVGSTRSGTTGTLRGVMTYRTNASSGSAVAVSDFVGGTHPAQVDPGAGSAGADFDTSSFVYGAVLTGTAQSVSPVTVGSANITGIDFGFNFDTVVNTNDSGQGSLRQAITNANTLGGDASLAQSGRTAAIENLVFMISNGSSAAGLRSSVNYFSGGVATIAPTSTLPNITTAMTINAQAQPGWSSAPIVEIAGTSAGSGVSGLNLQSHTGSTVRGLVVRNFTSQGINVNGGGSHTIAGNYLGITAAGTAAAANGAQGINVYQSASNLIGGTSASDRNVISGNGNNGIVVTGTGASGNLIRGNYVGTNAAGTAAIRNESLGIDIGSSGNTVGGTVAGAGNVISGNRYTGLLLESGATGTTMQGNTIGLNAAGTAAVANGYLGVYLGSTGNSLGGAVAGAGNVISGNASQGVLVEGSGNTIAGNTIGLNTAGTAAVANSYGVHINNVANTTIGGSSALARNVISGNTIDGVAIVGSNATGTTIQGNHIGTNPAGSAALGNGRNGVYVLGSASSASVGGSVSGAGNLIGGNGLNGLHFDSGSNTVQGNLIGTNAAGTSAIANASHGIYVGGGSSHVIGGTTALTRNTLSGNGFSGIFINGGGSHTVQGNYIGTSADGASALGNTGYYGLELYGSGSNQIGGTAAGAGNVISGQTGVGKGGIYLASNGNTVQGNKIGSNAAGTAGLPNAGPGIGIVVGSVVNNTIGGTAAGAANLIAYNGTQGVAVTGANSTGNLISRNLIHSNTGLGIDIVGYGLTANNGSKDNALGNAEMDTPVITAASLSGSTLTVTGYVGSAESQTNFANATVEIFNALADASGYGQGQTWLGTLTADANGNFSGSIANVAGVTAGSSRLTGTATDGSNNTSEFGPNALVSGLALSGTVFEDPNYGGGAGRSLAASSGVGLAGVTVELYDGNGNYISNTTSASGGSYAFTGLASNAPYFVRVVNSTVQSTRSGSVSTLVPVMTYRVEVPTTAAGSPVTDEVGGIYPGGVDTGAGSGGTALWGSSCAGENATCTFSGTRLVRFGRASTSRNGEVFRVMTGGTPCTSAAFGIDPYVGSPKACYLLNNTVQSLSSVFMGTANVSGLDFGFNFDTVVNTNDSSQGSLRQAITNANTLTGDASLAQSGRTAAVENVVFMISNGTSAAGLRSANNYFGTSAGAYNVATIAPTSSLPAIGGALVIDAQTQPGWTLNPIIELNGASAGSNGGLRFNVGGNTVRGLVINRFTGDGINLASAGNTVSGCWIGTNAAGTAASANTVWGIEVNASGNTIGGSTAAARNVVSGNGDLGIYVRSGSNNIIQGNYVGTNAAGTAAVANVSHGIMVHSMTSSTSIGGSNAGQGNLISGNGGIGIRLRSGSGSNIVRGNIIGLNAAANAAVPNASGIQIDAAGGNNQIGGTGGSDGNIIASNTGSGVAIFGTPAAAGNAILGNRIYSNGAIGIDLGTAAGNSGDGITVNTGAKTSSQPNLLMNYPVFTAATLSGTTLTVAGYVGSVASQSTFASSRVEVFVSDNTSANGSGQTYLGFVTADANGNFSGPVTVPGSVTLVAGTTRLTGTATDTGNNTSEFGPNFVYGLGIGGTVFEDVNYGGGAGRSRVASGGVGVSGATVELYRASGAYVGATTTGSGGSYSFANLAAEGYVVRVLTSSVQSTRSGSTASLSPVQTWRYESSWQTPAAVTNEVGGARPGVADSAAAPTLAWSNCASEGGTCTFTGTRVVRYGVDTRWTTRVTTDGVACLNGVFGDPAVGITKSCEVLTPHLHSASSVHLASAGATGVDFGFNFGTVVHTNDSGQGSLRQAITNANTLGGDASLAQSGRTAAIENLVFMIGNGSSAAGLRSANDFFGTSAGSTTVATITLASALPPVTSPLIIDAQTQPGWTLEPRIEINGNGLQATGFQLSGGASTLRGFVVNRLVNAVNSSNGLLTIDGAGGNTVQGNWFGVDASGATATTAQRVCQGVVIFTGGNQFGGATASARNVVGNTGCNGVLIWAGDGNVIEGNHIGTNAAGSATLANGDRGILVLGPASNTRIGGSAAGQGNVVSGNAGSAADMGAIGVAGSGGGTLIQGNKIGLNAAGTATLGNGSHGIYVAGSAPGVTIGGTTAGASNVISGHARDGVSVVGSGATGVAILGNSIYGNAGQGIDLADNGVTANDGAKTTGQPNLLMDHPVLTTARARGPQLTVAGHIGTAAGQSLFAGSRVELFVSDASGTHGSGRTYLGAITADGSGNFSGTITIPLTALRAGSVLTATATDAANNTSEFGANFNGLVVDWLINHNGDGVDANPGDGLCETSTAGQCTLRAAIMESNARAGADLAAFALPGCPGAGCVITPASALPAISEALTLDAQTQPGWTLAPIVDLRGTGAGNSHGLNIAATGSTVRGLVIGGFGQGGSYSGIYVNAGSTTIEGNTIGLAADGSTARANGAGGSVSGGVFVNSGSGIVIGGSTPAQRNVLSGNGGAGVWTNGGSATVIGNYIGTNSAGSAALGNGRWGVQIAFGSHQIGGAAAGQGNVISGNVGYQTGGIVAGSSGQTIQGNTIGLNAARTAAIPNGDASSTFASGIDLRSTGSGHLIGGTNPGEGNVIAGNAGHGVRVQSQTTRILGNSLYGNQWLGIDLNADGVTANDGAVSGAAPNNGMDFPVVGSAGYDGSTRVLTVSGIVGTGTGQATFAGARIEFFASDADSSGHGEGRDYLGTLTVDGNGRYSGSVTVPPGVTFAVGAALTATATDSAGNTSEFGPNYVVTTMAALVPSRFNLFETSTPSLALSGAIKTMTAGQARTLAAIAIDSAGTGLAPSFTGSVSLQWMDARDNGGALDAGGCRSSWVAVGGAASAGTAAFVGGTPRMNVSLTPAAVGREWRLRMSHTTGSGSVVSACTTDNFAVKPATIAVTALGSADSSTAGVGGAARSLTNAGASGGVVHRAGRPFALRAQGQDAGNALTAGYDGTAAIAITACVLPASGCTLGSLQHSGGAASLSATAGVLSSDTMTYGEVGAITVRLSDTSFADIDAADSTPAERLVQSGDITIGRFVPDRYTTSVTTAGVLGTVNAACTAAGGGYTFFGQAFGWAIAPQFTVTALNAQGTTTVNWAGSLQRLDAASHVAQSMAVSGVASSLSQTHGSPTLTDLGGGTARLSVPASASFALGRDPAAPVASATPVFGWAAAIVDTSEAAVTGNGSITGTATQSGIAFNGGALFHTGRLALAPGHGDARRGVRLLVELQRYSAAGWVTMTEDRGCITVSPMNITVASPQGVFTGSGVCAAPVQAAVTLRGGRGWMSLPATPGRAPGRLMTSLNLGSASSGLACSAVNVSAASLPMNLPHLMGAWGGVATLTADPRAALTWGRPNRDVMLTRERF